MSYTGSATAAWVAKYNAEVALYNSQVAATTVEHNARYVNNAGTGLLWSEQDAIDVAALNAANASLASMTTDRNNWQASSNAWQTNANTAYDSGVWGTGTPWSTRWSTTEAARVAAVNQAAANLPANLTVLTNSGSASMTGSGNSLVLASLQVSIAGYWACYCTGTSNSNSNNGPNLFRMQSDGVDRTAEGSIDDNATSGSLTASFGTGFYIQLGLNAVVRVLGRGDSGGPSMSASLTCVYVPTPAQPH